MLSISKATMADSGDVCAVDMAVIGSGRRRGYLERSIESGWCFAARVDGKVVGFAVYNPFFMGHTFIDLVCVHPDFRRRGAARALIARVEATCTRGKLFSSVNVSNEVSQLMHERLGFVRSGFIENLDPGDPEIIYYKPVGGAQGS